MIHSLWPQQPCFKKQQAAVLTLPAQHQMADKVSNELLMKVAHLASEQPDVSQEKKGSQKHSDMLSLSVYLTLICIYNDKSVYIVCTWHSAPYTDSLYVNF